MITIYDTPKRRALWKEFKEKARTEGTTASELFEKVLDGYLEKTRKTHNPQTTVEDFEDPAFKALPNLWMIDGPWDLDKVGDDTLRQILAKAGQLERLAERRLSARGVK